MPEPRKKFYITTPIYYANSRPHVGSAYTTIVCDVIARYKRMCGYDVAYLTGTDEHGVNIERAAEKLGISEKELVDRNAAIFEDLWKNTLKISYTHFIRTTSVEHARAVQTLVRRTIRRARDNGYIYKGKYEGRYCIYDNLYVSDTREPANCPICGRPAELISEDNYFFRLSAFRERLLAHYREHPEFVKPDFRRNEVTSFVEAGLKDISISRKSIKWGIPWPDDPEHVFYVWYDALTSYMTGIGFGTGPEGDASPEFKKYWPADVHMIGKEIIRFHAVYWPAFLMAAGVDLPKQIFAHGWLLFEQEKMSKSKGNVAYPEPIVNVLGNDALRYYLLRETVFGQDGNFSRDALITRYNADLANGLGNLASRVLTMVNQYFDGVMPGSLPGVDRHALEQSAIRIADAACRHYYTFQFSDSLQQIWNLVSLADFMLVAEQPWKQIVDPGNRPAVGSVLYKASEALRLASILAHPVIPEGTQKIWEQLGQTGKIAHVHIDELQWGDLKPGTRIGKLEAVFPRVDKEEASERIEAMEEEIRNAGATRPAAAGTSAAGAGGARAAATPSGNAKIGIEDFAKVEMRVGAVKSAEKVAGADKLLKILVDIGNEVRQVVAGIAEVYKPEDLLGKKVVVVVNLAPRKLRGVESNGMILAASVGPEGKPVLCTFTEDVPPGARIK